MERQLVLLAAVAAVLLASSAVEGLPHVGGQDINEVVPEGATTQDSAQGVPAVLLGHSDPDHDVVEDPEDPYESYKDPFSAKIDEDDDPMTVESKIPVEGDDWEKFALRHENEAEMNPTADDQKLDHYWKHDLNEPKFTGKMKVPKTAGLLNGMNKVCERLGQHLCADGQCSKNCATSQPDTATPYTVDPQDHQPNNAKAVLDIHHHDNFKMSIEDEVGQENGAMPPRPDEDEEAVKAEEEEAKDEEAPGKNLERIEQYTSASVEQPTPGVGPATGSSFVPIDGALTEVEIHEMIAEKAQAGF